MKKPKPTPTPRPGLRERTEEHVRRLQELLLAQLEQGARECAEVERRLGGGSGRETETLIKLHRVLVLKSSLDAESGQELVKMTRDLMRPVMEWARLEEKRRERDQAETARRNEAEGGGLTPETLERIERELNLL